MKVDSNRGSRFTISAKQTKEELETQGRWKKLIKTTTQSRVVDQPSNIAEAEASKERDSRSSSRSRQQPLKLNARMYSNFKKPAMTEPLNKPLKDKQRHILGKHVAQSSLLSASPEKLKHKPPSQAHSAAKHATSVGLS